MSHPSHTERETPGLPGALLFQLKCRILQAKRALAEIRHRPPFHDKDKGEAPPVASEMSAALWSGIAPAEFPLTAGKVQNLRAAARILDGVRVPAGQIFSFWRQLGRTTKSKGFTHGRELREGCLVPAVGGGLCQLSGLLYQAALGAGLEIVERHAHSRVIPGSLAERNLDATVFWNYVDLRFRGDRDWRLEVRLDATRLIVRILTDGGKPARPHAESPSAPSRAAPGGDCLTCGMVSCFRHPAATTAHAPAQGHSAYLLDARWPEFDRWCAGHSRPGDVWFTPLDGKRWSKPAYDWSIPENAERHHATVPTILRGLRQRRLPAQGAVRQRALLEADAALARRYAATLDPGCRHVVVALNLLPHLWRSGALGGRTFDVLVHRWPLAELQKRLDAGRDAHPRSTTFGDFRADPALVRDESEALSAAGRLVTPHLALADHSGARAWRIDWEMPDPLPRPGNAEPFLFFPCSRLGRKGAYELAEALRARPDLSLRHLGRAVEGPADPFAGLPCSQGTIADLASAAALVLPAWIEHQPRLALLALASGVPVIATRACGLPDHPQLHRIEVPGGLAAALDEILPPAEVPCAVL